MRCVANCLISPTARLTCLSCASSAGRIDCLLLIQPSWLAMCVELDLLWPLITVAVIEYDFLDLFILQWHIKKSTQNRLFPKGLLKWISIAHKNSITAPSDVNRVQYGSLYSERYNIETQAKRFIQWNSVFLFWLYIMYCFLSFILWMGVCTSM